MVLHQNELIFGKAFSFDLKRCHLLILQQTFCPRVENSVEIQILAHVLYCKQIKKNVPKYEFQLKFPLLGRKFVAGLEDEIFKVKRKSFFENKLPLKSEFLRILLKYLDRCNPD